MSEFLLKNNFFELNGTVNEQILVRQYELNMRLVMHAFL